MSESRLNAIRSYVEQYVRECEGGSTDIPCSVVKDMALLLAVVEAVIAVRSQHGLERAVRQTRFMAMGQPSSDYRTALETLADRLEEMI